VKKKIAAVIIVVLALAAVAWGVHRALDARNLAYDFTLTDHDGRPFKLSQERGHAVALFFGYTHCPDVCPATLARLASARAGLGKDRDRVRVIFITVDPTRDTPQRMKKYLATFDPSFIGVTGTESRLLPVYKAYHVWYQPLPKSTKGLEELEAHTATITMLDRSGHLEGYADWADPVTALTQDLRKAAS
jgi:cytochrome oxidase Cu insertion factor (SCO1/SenC/PrrC family)